jgi:hypothetical protein
MDNVFPHGDDARHGVAGIYPRIGVANEGRDVMGQHDTSFLRCPGQYRRIVCSQEADILNAYNI